MSDYLPVIAVISIILIIVLVSIQYTLSMILREIRAIRLKMPYEPDYIHVENRGKRHES
ncbi:MAG: hypothetical protein K5767_01070 [Clostridia bacterium]|nr:hypothetical protein [Clostridia bacterium]